MSVRDLAKIALIAGGGYVAYMWWQSRQGIGAPLDYPPGIDYMGDPITGDQLAADGSNYLAQLANAESSGQPYVKNTHSSASGLFQFLKKEWLNLGGTWGDNPALAFGGLFPSVEEQATIAGRLTDENVNGLTRAGIAISNATLYAAHFLGLPTAVKVLSADTSAPVAGLVSQSVLTANPFLRNMNVGQFYEWARQRIGG